MFMKAKHSLAVLSICLLVILAVAVGCSKKPSDAQIIGEVATKIQADPNMQTKAIAVQSADGVVTLSGTVNSDMERTAAANDAGQAQGVRTVVNNLTVQQAATPAIEPPVEEQRPQSVQKASARHGNSQRMSSGSRGSRPSNDYAPPTDTVAQAAPAPVQAAPVMPPPKPKPVLVTIPDGTQITIRLVDPLDSEKNQIGDAFRATLNHSIMVGDQVAIPSGADVMGRVIDVKGATHFSGKSVLAVELTNISMGGKNYELHTEEFRKEGTARGKNTAMKTGGGAAVGAIIGAIAGGGKGAAIGAAAGGATGAGVNAVTKGQKIQLPTESVLNFRLVNSLTVTPGAGGRNRNNEGADRPVLTDRSDNNPGE
jgi:hypothetical protein